MTLAFDTDPIFLALAAWWHISMGMHLEWGMHHWTLNFWLTKASLIHTVPTQLYITLLLVVTGLCWTWALFGKVRGEEDHSFWDSCLFSVFLCSSCIPFPSIILQSCSSGERPHGHPAGQLVPFFLCNTGQDVCPLLWHAVTAIYFEVWSDRACYLSWCPILLSWRAGVGSRNLV